MLDNCLWQTPVDLPRPRGAPRLEGWSAKLQRVVQLYDRAAFELWLLLESDPEVVRFCERPVLIDTPAGRWLADFYVRLRRVEELRVIEVPPQAEPVPAEAAVDLASRPAHVQMGDGSRIKIRYVAHADLLAARPWTCNWERMLPYLAANQTLLPRQLQSDVLRFTAKRRALHDVERAFAGVDLMLVRTAVFSLLHRGKLLAPSLRVEPLSGFTVFTATEAAR